MAGYWYISSDGGSSFTDRTPSGARGALLLHGMASYAQDQGAVFLLAGSSNAQSMDLLVTANAGLAWTTRQTGLPTPVGMFSWPYSDQILAFLTATKIYRSADQGVTLQDKTGNYPNYATTRAPVRIEIVW